MELNHGAVVKEIYLAYNVAKPEKMIDFSTNTNSVIMDGVFGEKGKSIDEKWLRELSKYPDSDCKNLLKSISESLLIDSSRLLALNGSNQGIYLIASYFSGKRVAIIEPTYPEYELALKAYDVGLIYYESLGHVDLEVVDGVFICNPNNPTGSYVEHKEMIDFLAKAESQGVVTVIDEAYIDFLWIEELDKSPIVDKIQEGTFKNTIILRSLTKVFLLAGIRSGYLIGSKEWIDKLKKRQPSWSVNTLAQRMMQGLFDPDNKDLVEHFLNKTKAYYRLETPRVVKGLESAGYQVIRTSVNFYVVQVDDDRDCIVYLLKSGIIPRHTRNHRGLDGKYLRFSVKSVEENNILMKRLKEYREMKGSGTYGS